MRSFPIALLVLAGLPAAVRSADDDQKAIAVYELSNDGDATLIIKVPDYYAVPDRSKHLGIAPRGTRVELLETRTDKSVPVLKWGKVRVLNGEYKGKIGWVISRTLLRVEASKADTAPLPIAERTARTSSPDKTKTGFDLDLYEFTRQARIVPRPSYQAAATFGADVGMATKGTLVQWHKASADDDSAVLRWYRVKVLTGKLKGKQGWVTVGNLKPVADPEVRLHLPPSSTPGAYDLLANLKFGLGISKNIEPDKFSLDMKHKSAKQWTSVDTTTGVGEGTSPTLEFTPRLAGRFEVRGTVTVGDKSISSADEQIEFRFPTAAAMAADTTVKSAMDHAWKETLKYYAGQKYEQKREFGFFVLLETSSGTYTTSKLDRGPPVKADSLKPGQINLGIAPKDRLTNATSPTGTGLYTVGHFHTHTPTYRAGDRKTAGPSTRDLSTIAGYKLAGLVYDYDDPPNVLTKPDSPAHVYTYPSYDSRRPTP